MAAYRLFVDDSGTREYDPARNYGLSGRSLYFVYGAVLVEERDGSLFAVRLQELKRLTFGVADVEVKSNWLRIPHERQARYLDKYEISQATLTKFVDDYYALLIQAPVRLLGSVVDKVHMQEQYISPWYAPTAAYEVLMQRVVQAVPVGSTLAVTVDDITGKTPAANKYKELLSAHHDRLRQTGSSLQPSISFACLTDPVRFMNSAHSDLIQVADLVAYNLQRQFRDHGSAWEQPVGPLPTYPYFERICAKFYQDAGGRIQGFGVVKFPLKNQVRWRIRKD